MNRDLENLISESMQNLNESMNVSMSMNTDATGGPSRSITVTATDDDAMKLGKLLKNAGLGGHDMGDTGSAEVEIHGAEDVADQIRQAIDGDHGHEHDGGEVCDTCGQEECGCEEVDEAYGDDVVSQNSPDFPGNTETSHDAFQYSGGLNKPKSSGMATIPVTDVQLDGEDKFASIARLREMAGISATVVEEVTEINESHCSKCDCDPCECEESVEESLARLREMSGIREAAKPDFLDVDKDGDKKEPFKKAVDDKKVDEGILASTASLWKQYKGQYGV
jgi:hypothetical protein